MKALFLSIALLVFIIFTSCQNVKVNYPIPLKSGSEFIITTSGGTYDDTLYVNTSDIFEDLIAELDKAGLTLDDLQEIILEGAAYTMTQTTDSNAVVEGAVDVQYIDPQFTEVLTVKPIVFLNILNQPQVDVLNKDGVTVLDQALGDLIAAPGVPRSIGVKSNGTLQTGGDITFTMLVEFTITAIVQKELTKLSPLG